MQNKSLFAGADFKKALSKHSDKVLSNIRQKQEDAKPKPMNANIKRDYNMVIVMRHSKRIDSHPNFAPHLKWDEKDEYLRPYDPPIVDFKLPIEKLKEIESFIPTINITKIIVSPYLRCIQTATCIAKYLQIKTFEIDARLGEHSKAINRCCQSKKNKQDSNKKTNYDIPSDYKDVKYLTMEQIKQVIIDLYNKDIKKNEDTNEEKKADDNNDLIEKDLMIEWNHKEPAGNELHVECAKEYRDLLIKQQQNKEKEKDKQRNDILLVTHAQVVSDISEDLCGKILTVAECGWICLTHNESTKIYSPTTIKIFRDKNAQD